MAPLIHSAGMDHWYSFCICCSAMQGPFTEAEDARRPETCFRCQCLQRKKKKPVDTHSTTTV